MSYSDKLLYDWSKTPVLITGAAGFLGSHLSERLYELGAKLTLIDNYSNAAFSLGEPIGHQSVLPISVYSSHLTKLIAENPPKVIFHLAGNAYAAGSINNPVKDMRANLDNTFQFLDALRIFRYSGVFLYVSSAAIYGEPRYLPIDENHPIEPISPYGVSKLAAERYVSVYANLYGIKAVSVRPFSLYGPRQRKQVIYDLIQKLRRPDTQIFFGDGNEIRDFIYVTDAVEAMLAVVHRGVPNGSSYNLCSGIGITIRQLADEISELIGKQTSFQFSGERRPGDPVRWVGSAERLRELGFLPKVSLRDGLRRTIAWFLESYH